MATESFYLVAMFTINSVGTASKAWLQSESSIFSKKPQYQPQSTAIFQISSKDIA